MVKGIGNITFWPGVGPALGEQAGDGRKTYLAFFSWSHKWHQLLGTLGREGGSSTSATKSVNNRGKRERECEVAL